MEFSLRQNQQISFRVNSKGPIYGYHSPNYACVNEAPRSTIANVSLKTNAAANSLIQNVVEKLRSKLQSSEPETVGRSNRYRGPSAVAEPSSDWVVYVTVGFEPNPQPNTTNERRHFIVLSDNSPQEDEEMLDQEWMSYHNPDIQFASYLNKRPSLTALQEAVNSLNYQLKLKVTISNFNTNSTNRLEQYYTNNGQYYPIDTTSTLETFESTIEEFRHLTRVADNYSEYDLSKDAGVRLFVSTLPNSVQSSRPWTGNISITGILYPTPNQIPGCMTSPDRCISKTILDEEIQTDVVLRAKGNIDVKCHRAFLCAHSSVFQAMFKKPYKESATGTVDLSDMTGSGVKAFLAYLYYADVSKPNDSASIALELLKAGHKYDILELEEYMRTILLAKDEGMYDVEVAMKLYTFSRKIENGEDLKVKAVSVLKVYNKELLQSETYKKMFLEDPEATMELVQLAFSVC